MRQRGIHLHKLANFVAVSYRHEHIGEHQVRTHVRELSHGRFAIPNGDNVDALILQSQTDHLLDVAVVVRDQNLRHYTPSGEATLVNATWALPQQETICPASLYWSIRGRGRQSPRGTVCRKAILLNCTLLPPPKPTKTKRMWPRLAYPLTLLRNSFLSAGEGLPGNDFLQSLLFLAAGLFLAVFLVSERSRIRPGLLSRGIRLRCIGRLAGSGRIRFCRSICARGSLGAAIRFGRIARACGRCVGRVARRCWRCRIRLLCLRLGLASLRSRRHILSAAGCPRRAPW